MSSANGTSSLRVNVALLERDVVKLILDFLQQRELYISMLDIERETGLFEQAIIVVRIWFSSLFNARHYQRLFFGRHSLSTTANSRRSMG
jgi:hypothetical protein